MQRAPTETIEFRTVQGLLIADTLIRDVPGRGEAAAVFVGFEEPAAEREWFIQIYRDEAGGLTAVSVIDRAQLKPGDLSGP